MRSPPITRDDVYEAALQLVEKNEQPSTKAIRDLLRRGSYSTITKFLRDWEALPANERTRTDNPGDQPPEIRATARRLADTVWELAVEQAKEVLAYREKQLEQREKALLEDMARVAKDADLAMLAERDAREVIEAGKKAMDKLIQEHADLQGEHSATLREVTRLANTCDRQADQLRELDRVNERLTAEVEHEKYRLRETEERASNLESALDSTKKELAVQNENAWRLEQQLDEAHSKIADVKQAHHSISEQLNAAHEESAKKTADLRLFQASLEEAGDNRIRAEAALKEASKQIARLETQLEAAYLSSNDLTAKLETRDAELLATRDEALTAKIMLSTRNDQIQELESRLADSQGAIAELQEQLSDHRR